MKGIKSNNIITPKGIVDGVIIIEDGKITDICEKAPEGIEIIDAGENVVMPGVIDTHVHVNEPGRTSWEGFDTAAKAALAGGVTTLVDMPLNASPVTTTLNAFDQKLASTEGKLHTNFGFWGGVIPGNENEIQPLINKGVLGFKAFLTHSGIDEFPNVTEEDLRKAMPVIAMYNLPLLVHCELSEPNEISDKAQNNSYKNYLESRPKHWEDDAIALMIRLCEEFNCRVHIVHLSSANSIEQIQKAKQEGLPLTVETAQHYLFFNAEEIEDGNTALKCAPPIREKANNEKLWEALKAGIIDFVATDHSPATPNLKEIESGDFMKAWGGIASIQFALPVLWTAAKNKDCTLSDITKWLCENPAKLAGLENTKGKIEKGYDADIIILDPEEKFMITEDIIQHKHKVTPYLHKQLSGVIKQTFLNGELVFDNGKFLHLNKGKILLNL